METTLLILKPDALHRGLMGRLISRFEEKGLQIVGMKMVRISDELADEHYAEHVGKPFYPSLKAFMTSAPVVVMAVRGVSAIAVCRKMMGKTYGVEAEAGTIRGDFGVSRTNNLIHGSDGPEAAAAELGRFFKPEELFDYTPALRSSVYDMSSGEPV